MFELSHRLIGIYKTANATRSEHDMHRTRARPDHNHTGISIDNQPLHAVPLNVVAA